MLIWPCTGCSKGTSAVRPPMLSTTTMPALSLQRTFLCTSLPCTRGWLGTAASFCWRSCTSECPQLAQNVVYAQIPGQTADALLSAFLSACQDAGFHACQPPRPPFRQPSHPPACPPAARPPAGPPLPVPLPPFFMPPANSFPPHRTYTWYILCPPSPAGSSVASTSTPSGAASARSAPLSCWLSRTRSLP